MPPPGGLAVLERALDDVESRLHELAAPTGTQRAQAVKRLGETIDAVPSHHAIGATRSNFSVPSNTSWSTFGSASVAVPPGKTRAAVFVRGFATVKSRNMYTYTILQGRVLINGSAGRTFDCTYQVFSEGDDSAIVYTVNGFATAAALDVVEGDSVTATFQLRRNDGTLPIRADARNQAQLAASVVFT